MVEIDKLRRPKIPCLSVNCVSQLEGAAYYDLLGRTSPKIYFIIGHAEHTMRDAQRQGENVLS